MTQNQPASHVDGYRLEPAGGPRLRTDIVDVYVFRQSEELKGRVELLLLQRASEPLAKTWQPVMGHIESGETATQAALRELDEEIGLRRDSLDFQGFWALEQTHPYFVAPIDAIVLSPRFAAQVSTVWEPVLNCEHAAHQWIRVTPDDLESSCLALMWPGQKSAVTEIMREIVRPGSLSRERLAINPRGVPARPQP